MKILLMIVLLLGGCKTVEEPPCDGCTEPAPPDPLVLVGPFTLSAAFEDGTAVTGMWNDPGFFFREGHTTLGDCRISRTPTEKSDDGLIFMKLNGTTETCTGTTCTHCAFKKAGGCECKNLAQGICTHTISRNRDLMRIR